MTEVNTEDLITINDLDDYYKSDSRELNSNKDRTLFEFITGKAGSGKTTLVRSKLEKHPELGELCSTTGIAAINMGLGCTTIHSKLKYFDTKSLIKAYESGHLHWNLRKLRAKNRLQIYLDEASMFSAKQLDTLVSAINEVNNDRTGTDSPMGLTLIGDLCQLPVVSTPDKPEEMIFNAKCWYLFDNNTTLLTKVWRQDNPIFIEAINKIREANGKEAVALLKECGVKFTDSLNESYDGTTIIPTNKLVDDYNLKQMNKVNNPLIRVCPKKVGKPSGEWNLIPVEMRFKVGVYVMILANDTPNFRWVNGDCGVIESYDSKNDEFLIRLKRTNEIVRIGRISRLNLSVNQPNMGDYQGEFKPHIDIRSGDWVIGEMSYHPIRLAYASTVHKTQGLSLDSVQLDIRHSFFGNEGMAYVGISRARNPNNLVIVGSENELARKIKTNPDVLRWV